ncbi:MAG: hypothetical protein LBU51_00505 [Bacteroidales bacterium]|jgi:PIN domain nuclease of toxin-antitoxin system|nr:hypothetical protein [Bacteroidales bacterium]
MIYVLDASALIAFFKKEEGKEKVWDKESDAWKKAAIEKANRRFDVSR